VKLTRGARRDPATMARSDVDASRRARGSAVRRHPQIDGDAQHVRPPAPILHHDAADRLAVAELPVRAAGTVLCSPRLRGCLVVLDPVDDALAESRRSQRRQTRTEPILDRRDGGLPIAPRVIAGDTRRRFEDGPIERPGDVFAGPLGRSDTGVRRGAELYVGQRDRRETDGDHGAGDEHELGTRRHRDFGVWVLRFITENGPILDCDDGHTYSQSQTQCPS